MLRAFVRFGPVPLAAKGWALGMAIGPAVVSDVAVAPPVSTGATRGDLGPYLAALHARWLISDVTQRWREIDGSLLMADVSGFTPLAERLARRGKVGAEELTDILNTVFCDLLAVGIGLGGDCLKFGGDAIFLLFSGPGHAGRAAGAADRMGRLLGPGGALARALGSVKLGLSLGVHSGVCQLYLAGHLHEELVVVGPAVDETLAMEAGADRGEVLVSRATAALLEREAPDTVGRAKGSGRLLIGSPQPPPLPIDRPAVGPECISGLPVGLRAELSGERRDGEHRLATVAFVAFAGTDLLLSSGGPAAVSAALDELMATAQEACARWAVTFLATDVNRDGGKIILAAGVPHASRDSDEQVLQVLHDILGTPSRLSLRAGVNRGRIFAVDLGSAGRRAYTVIGDAVNLAARVAFKAEPGQVVATLAVLERVRSDFALAPLEPFMVKGKAQAVNASVVGPARGARRQSAPQALPVVGRSAELAVLRNTVASAHEGVGHIVQLVGEAGIGKSRLVAEAVRLSHGLPHLAIEGGQYSQAAPYFALRGPLRRLLGIDPDSASPAVERALIDEVVRRAPHLQPWLPLLAVPFGLDMGDTPETRQIDQRFRRVKLHAVSAEFIQRLMSGPFLVTIEDSHWLDGGTAELLAALTKDVGRKPWAVVVTRRDVPHGLVPADDESVTSLRLSPLDDEAAMALAMTIADESPVPRYVLANLAERSAGNPLFLQELLLAAAQRRQAGIAPLEELPDNVEAIMASSIDTLAPADRKVLRSAAVLGHRFRTAELVAMLRGEARDGDDRNNQRDVLEPVLARLGHFLVPDGRDRLHFRHILLREVAYEGLAFRTRRTLHERAAQFLEQTFAGRTDEVLELLALHFSAGHRFDRAWTYSRLAADRAQHGGSLFEASNFLTRSLEASRHLRHLPVAEVAATWERLGDVCELSGRYPEAAAAYRQARRRRRGDALALADLCRKEGWVRERSTRYAEALRWYTRGFGQLGPASGTDRLDEATLTRRARLTLARGSAMVQQGRYREGIPLVEEAARLAGSLGDPSMLGHAYYVLDWALTDTGSPERHRYRPLIVEVYEQLDGDPRQGTALNNLGANAYFEGQWTEALEYYRRAQESQARIGDVIGQAMTVNNIGEILCDQGHLDKASESFRETLRVVRAASFSVGTGFALANLGRVATRSGRLVEAAELLASARALFEAAGAQEMVLETDAKEVERLLLAGDPAGALALADRVLELFTQQTGGNPLLPTMLHRCAGLALTQLGDDFRPEAVGRLDLSLAQAREAGADYEAACTLAALASVGPFATGTAGEEAAAIFERLGVVRPPAGVGISAFT